MTTLTTYEPAPVQIADYQTRAVQRLGEWASSADAAFRVAQRLVETAFVPQQFKNKPMEATAAILAGAEVGLSPMASLRSFDIIQGQAAPRALTLRAIVQSYGHEIVLVESTATRCRMRGKRRGADEWQSVSWTIDRARDLGLVGKDNWKKQPAAMLVARATSEIARLIAADAILGIGYTAEEIADGATGDVTLPAEDGEGSPATPSAGGKRTLSRRRTPEPEPAAEPDLEPTATPITKAQNAKMHALFADLGIADHDAQIAGINRVIGREISSKTELTLEEAAFVIDSLEIRLRQQAEDTTPEPADTLPGIGGEA